MHLVAIDRGRALLYLNNTDGRIGYREGGRKSMVCVGRTDGRRLVCRLNRGLF